MLKFNRDRVIFLISILSFTTLNKHLLVFFYIVLLCRTRHIILVTNVRGRIFILETSERKLDYEYKN